VAVQDVGLTVVDRLYESLMVNTEWSIRGPRGFTWWSYRLAQHVEASVPVFVGDRLVCEIRIWTEVVSKVDPDKPVTQILVPPNTRATLSAMVWDPARRTITDYCVAVVHDGNACWMGWLLPVAAAMQNTATHTRAQSLADMVNGVPALSSHLESGQRPDVDELLSAPERLIAPEGKQQSKFIGELTRSISHSIGRRGFACFGESNEFTCELPFSGLLPMAFLTDLDPVETSLLEVFADVEHPNFGSGALMALSLPLRFDPSAAAEVANWLNLLEARAVLPVDSVATQGISLGVLLGAWSPDPRAESRDRIAFNSFVPSVLARPGLLECLVHYQAIRSDLAARALGVSESGVDDVWRHVATADDAGDEAAERRIEASARADVAVRAMRDAASKIGTPPTSVQPTSWRMLVDSRPTARRPGGPVISDDEVTPEPAAQKPAAMTKVEPSAVDTGLRLVTKLMDHLMIDAAWAVPEERGFTWWSYRLAQHVQLGPPEWNGEVNLCNVRIWTEMVRDVDGSENLMALLGAIDAESTLSAVLWQPAERLIVDCFTATVHEQNIDWFSTVLATAAAMQNTDAHARAQALARACGGVLDVSNHRLNGMRPEMDDLLNVPRDIVARVGTEPSHFAGLLMEGVTPWLRQMNFCGSSDASDMTCEVPYTGSTPVAVLADRGGPVVIETSLVQIDTATLHSAFGNGADLVIKLPAGLEPSQVDEWANWLNASEAQGASNTPLLGAWCPDSSSSEDRTLFFHSFLANVIAMRGALENHTAYQATRSRWAAEQVGR